MHKQDEVFDLTESEKIYKYLTIKSPTVCLLIPEKLLRDLQLHCKYSVLLSDLCINTSKENDLTLFIGSMRNTGKYSDRNADWLVEFGILEDVVASAAYTIYCS